MRVGDQTIGAQEQELDVLHEVRKPHSRHRGWLGGFLLVWGLFGLGKVGCAALLAAPGDMRACAHPPHTQLAQFAIPPYK